MDSLNKSPGKGTSFRGQVSQVKVKDKVNLSHLSAIYHIEISFTYVYVKFIRILGIYIMGTKLSSYKWMKKI